MTATRTAASPVEETARLRQIAPMHNSKTPTLLAGAALAVVVLGARARITTYSRPRS
jgi:hypothetical protein